MKVTLSMCLKRRFECREESLGNERFGASHLSAKSQHLLSATAHNFKRTFFTGYRLQKEQT